MTEVATPKKRLFRVGDVVTLKTHLAAYFDPGIVHVPMGTAAVVQRNQEPGGLVFFVCPELRDKRELFLNASALELVRSRTFFSVPTDTPSPA